MKNNATNPKVNFYFDKKSAWQEEFELLRTIALGCGLDEELKWGHPCYVLGKKNIVLMHGFKDYCALLFFKGSLLKDSAKVLTQQTENVQVARQWRFTKLSEIEKSEALIGKYIREAIDTERSGIKAVTKTTAELEMPEEFQSRLNKNAALRKAFTALTPGRQRGYLLFFSAAKQSKTREARIEKNIQNILNGKGLTD